MVSSAASHRSDHHELCLTQPRAISDIANKVALLLWNGLEHDPRPHDPHGFPALSTALMHLLEPQLNSCPVPSTPSISDIWARIGPTICPSGERLWSGEAVCPGLKALLALIEEEALQVLTRHDVHRAEHALALRENLRHSNRQSVAPYLAALVACSCGSRL